MAKCQGLYLLCLSLYIFNYCLLGVYSQCDSYINYYENYSNSNFSYYTSKFVDIVGLSPILETLAQDSTQDVAEFHEGPVYHESTDGEGYLLYTNQPQIVSTPRGQIKRYNVSSGDISVFRSEDEANMPNGQTLDRSGRLLTCEQGFSTSTPGRITRTDLSTGEFEIIIDSNLGLPLNSPNDVVEKSDHSIWFTDPPYAYFQTFKEEPKVGRNVYRYDKSAEGPQLIAVLDRYPGMPNGLAFSPDEKYLYITDSGAQMVTDYFPYFPHSVYRYNVCNGKYLSNRILLAVISSCVTDPSTQNSGIPDGIKLDEAGNIYVAAGDGVQVYDPDGQMLGKIHIPNGTPNIVFGGKDLNDLYILADSTLYRVSLQTKGATYDSAVESWSCEESPSPTNASMASLTIPDYLLMLFTFFYSTYFL